MVYFWRRPLHRLGASTHFLCPFYWEEFCSPSFSESGERPKSFGEEIGQSLLLSTGVFRFQIGSDRVQIELIVQN